ncbi:preprotein translocase YidC [Actinomyces sp. oral taxon 414]|uniref:membrane protein insertase YidC n=1 Tax=Actinomyces sp. oral taxon 414 TaxID=712122 RepID=UPI0006AFB67E|nr:membrane protein insertase YidC [Actinomyces sp. oral taxon 414]ALD00296.1 preprotein translocase YidC [Actinomyces sp. oral taxon 414]
MDTILWPLKVAVAWVMVRIHDFLVLIGMGKGPGAAWVLSIVGLTIVMRLLIMPLFVRQIRASRGMQLMQPELKAIQDKYKGKKDQASRQRMQEEMMALYRKHGTNPFSSCFPILLQMPVFFALFRVLANLQSVASHTYPGHDSIGPLTAALADEVQRSTVFGASLSSSFMNASDSATKIVTVVMIVMMSVTQWYTMAQLSTKNMPESAKTSDNPMMRSQKIMMTVMPIFFAFTGIQFQIGVLVYWVTTNLWTMGQQFFTIRNMPAPGSEAEKKYRARINAKRARRGQPSLEEEEAAKRAAEAAERGQVGGQRVQPVRKSRQRRGPSAPTAPADAQIAVGGADAEESAQSGKENVAGLTPEEISRRRYEKRARQRQQRRNKNQGGKKRRR